MNNIDQLKKFLIKMEKQNTYFYRHGGDIIFAFISIIIIMCIFSYVSFKKIAVKIKNNWQKYRCDPGVTPFAGFINAPPNADLKDKINFTINNFGKCNMEVLESNINKIKDPITKIQGLTSGLFAILRKGLNVVRGMYKYLKDLFNDLFGGFMNILANIMTELFKFLGNLFDLLNRLAATLISGFLFGVGQAYVTISMLKAIIPICIIIIVIMIICLLIFIALTWVPFVGPVFYALSIATVLSYLVFIPIIIVIIIFTAVVMGKVEIQDRNCFDANTLLETKNGIKKIKDIKPGDILKNNNRVESILKLKNIHNEIFYELNGVLVTGEHYVYTNDDGWVMVKHAKLAKKTDKISDVLYCLITSKKYILINGIKFSDWDDLEEHEKLYLKNKFNITETSKINRYTNSLLHPETNIKLQNGQTKKIYKIKEGDYLYNGEQVTGIIKSLAPELPFMYTIKNKTIIGKHMHYKNLGDYKQTKYSIFKDTTSKYYYHLLTDTKTFYIDNVEILDYNGCVENILDNALEYN